MSADEFLNYFTQGVLLLIALLVIHDLVRHPERNRLDVALMFAVFAAAATAQNFVAFWGWEVPWLGLLTSAAILSQPYLLLQITGHLKTIPKTVRITCALGMILSWVVLLISPYPLPLATTLALIAYFAFFESYAGFAILRGALSTGGVTKRRLTFAALGCGGLVAALVFAGVDAAWPAASALGQPLSRVAALVMVLGWYIGFSPPAFVRQAWRLQVLYDYISSISGRAAQERAAAALDELCTTASGITGALASVTFLWDDAEQCLSARASDHPELLSATLVPTHGAAAWAWHEGKTVVANASGDLGPDEARQAAHLGASAVLAIPIATVERVRGLLVVFLQHRGIFIGDDIDTLAILAERCAINLSNAEAVAQERAAIEQLEASNMQLQATQARFQALFQTAPDGVVSADQEGLIVLMNHGAERMFGYRAEEIVGKPVTILMPVRLHTPHLEGLQRFLATGESRVIGRSVELVGKRRDGTEFPIELSLAHWKVGDGDFFTALVRDITERKLAQEAITERTAELEAAVKELEAFSYSVSHDLRAPLRAIDGFSRILVEEHGPHLPDEAQRYLRIVRDNAQQMGRLIDDLLAFSRLSRQSLTKQVVVLRDVAKQALEDLQAEQEGRQIEITFGTLPPCQADPALMRQVLVNLLSNALKYTRRREEARIEVGSLEEGGECIYFVRDNGAGFDMRYADKLFGVFQRLHRADEFEGTGVGLAIVQRIIYRHGGRVWGEAEPDKGATFFFTL